MGIVVGCRALQIVGMRLMRAGDEDDGVAVYGYAAIDAVVIDYCIRIHRY